MEEGAEVGCGRWDGVVVGGAGVRFGGIVLGGGGKMSSGGGLDMKSAE